MLGTAEFPTEVGGDYLATPIKVKFRALLRRWATTGFLGVHRKQADWPCQAIVANGDKGYSLGRLSL